MAKPKVGVIVNICHSNGLEIYCDNHDDAIREILQVEGIYQATSIIGAITAFADPRYDINELRDEIYQLLTASVPDVFKEDQ